MHACIVCVVIETHPRCGRGETNTGTHSAIREREGLWGGEPERHQHDLHQCWRQGEGRRTSQSSGYSADQVRKQKRFVACTLYLVPSSFLLAVCLMLFLLFSRQHSNPFLLPLCCATVSESLKLLWWLAEKVFKSVFRILWPIYCMLMWWGASPVPGVGVPWRT